MDSVVYLLVRNSMRTAQSVVGLFTGKGNLVSIDIVIHSITAQCDCGRIGAVRRATYCVYEPVYATCELYVAYEGVTNN